MKKLGGLLCILTALILSGTAITGTVMAEDIKVGIVLPLTGKLAKFGEIEQKSFLMAVDEINTAGGIKGKKIDLIIEDTTGKPDIGRSAIEKLISKDRAVIVGGGYSSSVTWASVAVAQQRKIPFLVNTGSADRITEKGWEYIFRLNPPVSEYPKALASFLKKIGSVKTAVILYENSLFGQSGAKKFVQMCKRSGIKVLMKEGYEAGAIDFKPVLVKARAKKPDLVYMISYIMDAALLIRQSKELDFNPKLFVGGAAGFTLPEFFENAGDASEYIFSATLWTPSAPYPGAMDYYNKFVAKYGSPAEYHGAEAYAAMYVIADALKRAKSASPQDVRDALAETDMMTIFGPVKFISYGKKTQQNRLPTFLVQWVNGKLETVWPEDVATIKYIYPVPRWRER